MSKDKNSDLPKSALDEIPAPVEDALSITGLVKKGGKVVGYQLSDDRIITQDEGVRLAGEGKIKGVGIAHNGDTKYLKSIPDDTENNNLSNLPTVSEEIE